MGNLNKVILIGYVGQVELVNANGTPICNATLATHESWTDKKSGNKMERTEWHRLVLFNDSAQNFAKFVGKGRNIYIEGRMQTREHPAKAFTWNADYKQRQPINFGDGQQAQIAAKTTEIVVSHWQFMDKKPEASAYTPDAQNAGAVVVGTANANQAAAVDNAALFQTPPEGV